MSQTRDERDQFQWFEDDDRPDDELITDDDDEDDFESYIGEPIADADKGDD